MFPAFDMAVRSKVLAATIALAAAADLCSAQIFRAWKGPGSNFADPSNYLYNETTITDADVYIRPQPHDFFLDGLFVVRTWQLPTQRYPVLSSALSLSSLTLESYDYDNVLSINSGGELAASWVRIGQRQVYLGPGEPIYPGTNTFIPAELVVGSGGRLTADLLQLGVDQAAVLSVHSGGRVTLGALHVGGTSDSAAVLNTAAGSTFTLTGALTFGFGSFAINNSGQFSLPPIGRPVSINNGPTGVLLLNGDLSSSGNGTSFSNAGLLIISPARQVVLSDATVANSGSINVVGAPSFPSGRLFLNPISSGQTVTLTGGGVITLSGSDNWTGEISFNSGDTGPVINADNRIAGNGFVTVSFGTSFFNGGTISADVSGRTLDLQSRNGGAMVNNSTLEAVNGGNLSIRLPVDNASGTIEALAGSSTSVAHPAVVTGGVLIARDGGTLNLGGLIAGASVRTFGTGRAVAASGRLSNATLQGVLTVENGMDLTVGGTFINLGTVAVTGAWLDLYPAALGQTVTLTGGGVISVSGSNGLTGYVDVNRANTGSVVNTDNVIRGEGFVRVYNGTSFLNGSVVVADVAGRTLRITRSGTAAMVNTGTLEAVNGGHLSIQLPINNSSGTIRALANSTVSLTGSSPQVTPSAITGGTWQATGSGTIQFFGVNSLQTIGATVIVDGPASRLLGSTGQAILSGVSTISATGSLALIARTESLPNLRRLDGRLEVGNGATVTTSTAQALAGAGSATVAPTGTLLSSSINLNGLSVSGTARVSAGSPSASVLGSLTISGTGYLDLGETDLVVRNGDAAALSAAVRSWWNAGTRDGNGLGTTSLAQGLPAAQWTTLAVVSNRSAFGFPQMNIFSGVNVSATDVLVKYTYLGDTDLSGTIDARDLSTVLRNWSNGTANAGWAGGDTNYDGVVDAADYLNVLSALTNQGAPLLGGEGRGGGAIPEPTTALALLAPAALALRRARRR